MGAEAGDEPRQGDAAAPVLQGEGPGEEAPAALVGGGEEPVEGTVGLGGRAVRLLPASQAPAAARDRPPFLWDIRPVLPARSLRGRKDIVTQDQATYFAVVRLPSPEAGPATVRSKREGRVGSVISIHAAGCQDRRHSRAGTADVAAAPALDRNPASGSRSSIEPAPLDEIRSRPRQVGGRGATSRDEPHRSPASTIPPWQGLGVVVDRLPGRRPPHAGPQSSKDARHHKTIH